MMTKEEAKQIKALDIKVDKPTEDWFYLLMVPKGKVSKEMGKKALERIRTYSEKESAEGLMRAEKMECNLKKYGIPCADWVK